MTWRIGVASCLLFGVAGCGLALDYGPPDPQHRDGGSQGLDATVVPDAGTDAAIDDGAVVEEDAVIIGGDATSMGCASDIDCGTGTICVSDCMGSGHCVPNDIPCSQTPTCGCDGVTYDSLCEAHAAHVEAAQDPTICFGCAAPGVVCPGGELCLGCPGAPPSCMLVPEPPCFESPVCGCDGQTYTSNCEAQSAGNQTWTAGSCPGTCVTSLECGTSEYCARTTCGDSVGTCAPIGTSTTLLVCGCSGRRYRSSREALRREGLIGTCDRCLGHASTCCADSNDCGDHEACVGAADDCSGGGTCEPLSALLDGQCWSDADCAPRSVCVGANVCPCGAQCLQPDVPGACVQTP